MERPGVGISAIVLKGKKVLLGKRKGSHGAGTWAFPGGHLELFEDYETCILREIEEETGLKIEIIDKNPVAVTNDFFPEGKHYITLFIKAKWISGEAEVKEKEKCEEWKWFSWDNLPSLLFTPVKNLIKQNFNPFK
ncbi:NUDIX domain-containing protein [Candidatus Pacearchaeota archaeon]|nr:NUDIX domain-containing protein [Candidatus Pacearchaeota archaeon]